MTAYTSAEAPASTARAATSQRHVKVAAGCGTRPDGNRVVAIGMAVCSHDNGEDSRCTVIRAGSEGIVSRGLKIETQSHGIVSRCSRTRTADKGEVASRVTV